MISVQGTRKGQLKKAIIGAHPIIQHYIEKLNLPDILSTYISSDKRLIITAADSICVLIHNILTQPMALYKLPEWIETVDMEALGFSHYKPAQFNDDRIARLLDCVYLSNRKQIFFRIALRAIKIFELNCKHIHQDTTTIKLCGRYDTWNKEPVACSGISKDHRPDLKQIVLGMNMVADGAVHISHDLYSGNRTDDTIHISNWDKLRRLLQTTDFMYTADSKLCTDKNLSHIEFYGGEYITVMPRTWKEDALFREKVQNGTVAWKLIHKRPSNRKPDSKIDNYYTTKSDIYRSENRRIVWIKSSQKKELDSHIREELLEKSIHELKALNAKINRYNLKKLTDIKTAVIKVLTTHKTNGLIRYSIEQRTMVKNVYASKGRPAQASLVKLQRWKEYRIIFEINTDEVRKQSKTDGLFPLITNNVSKSPEEILITYKYQSFLENRHSQLKSYLEITPIYLKKPSRVLALVDVVVIALTVMTLMERDLRKGMKTKGIDSIPIYPEQRECKHPTTQSIIRVFSGVEKFELLDKNNKVIEYFPPSLNILQKQILELMEVPVNLFA